MEKFKKTTTLFKFMSVRPPSEIRSEDKAGVFAVQPKTKTVSELMEIVDGNGTLERKAIDFEAKIKAFVDGDNFIKTEQQLEDLVGSSVLKKVKKGTESDVIGSLYDNLVIHTLTNSANTKLFKLICDSIVEITLKTEDGEKLSKDSVVIRMPKGLMPITAPKATVSTSVNSSSGAKPELAVQYQTLLARREELRSKPVNLRVQLRVDSPEAREDAVQRLEMAAVDHNAELEDIDQSINNLQKLLIHSLEPQKLAFIGNSYHNLAQLGDSGVVLNDDEPVDPLYNEQCELVFPIAIADLRLVEKEVVGFVPSEIAHINNTEKGSYKERTTTRTLKTETFESLMTENEVFSERDNQTTERFSLEKESADTQSEETSVNVGASVSASYGPVKAEVSGGYSNTQSSNASQSNAQSYSKETVEKAIDRVSSKIRQERSTRTIEEFIELNSAQVDLKGVEEHSVATYRWLNKLVKATLKNYGKRLMVEIGVAHPAHYYLKQAIKAQQLVELPIDPRKDKTLPLSPSNINRDNYLDWGTRYNARLEHPPAERVIVSDFDEKAKNFTIPPGYHATKAYVNKCVFPNDNGWGDLIVLVGRIQDSLWISPSNPGAAIRSDTVNLHYETGQLPIAFMSSGNRLKVVVEVECLLTPEAFNAWQTKCYFALIEAYENLKAEAESKMSEFDTSLPGLHPTKKLELIKTELKKACFAALHRCKPFWVRDVFKVGTEYIGHCCYDHTQSQRVKFLEGLFDFDNMSYELHDYYWARKNDWDALLALTDDDPHFEKFLQASYATVRVPVHRNPSKEVAALNLIANGSIENYITQIPELLDFLAELEPENENTKFTFDINNKPLDTPVDTVELGYYQLPTSLVILEQDSNGIEINGFPDLDDKFFSPAIIESKGSGK